MHSVALAEERYGEAEKKKRWLDDMEVAREAFVKRRRLNWATGW